MAPTMKDLGIDRLSVEDRLALAQEIWESTESDLGQRGLSDAQAAELDRRVAHADADPSGGVPWDVVKAEALARARR